MKAKRLELGKINGTENPADWLTKPLSIKSTMDAMKRRGFEILLDEIEEVGPCQSVER